MCVVSIGQSIHPEIHFSSFGSSSADCPSLAGGPTVPSAEAAGGSEPCSSADQQHGVSCAIVAGARSTWSSLPRRKRLAEGQGGRRLTRIRSDLRPQDEVALTASTQPSEAVITEPQAMAATHVVCGKAPCVCPDRVMVMATHPQAQYQLNG